MSDFPSHPDDVTADWLNDVLEGTSALAEGPIQALMWHPIGTGQVGDSVRFDITHFGGENSSLAAKFPAANEVSRGTAAMMGLYEKEVRFYNEVAPNLAVRVPHTYVAEANGDGTEFILLFEDLGPARGGNQIAGCEIDDARAAIRQAAAIHAPSWQARGIIDKEWLIPGEDLSARIKAMYPQAQAIFAERYAHQLEPEFMDLCEKVAASQEALRNRSDQRQCLVHGDFRLDNMLFDIKGGHEPVAILDWQTVTAGKAMTDIGYFLGCGIGDDLRRAHEDELLDLYLAEMQARGVALSRADIWRDYRIGALHGLTTGVFSAAFVERTERGDANFLSMVRGACSLALHHNSLEALHAST